MARISSVAVFCGARSGQNPAIRAAAEELGAGLARENLRLVFGGGRIGLMGAVADAVIAGGGETLGVIPDFLQRAEVAHGGLGQLIVTDSMHARKQIMFREADAFVSFAGGLGTMDETFEILTWRQLGLHDKPIILCDVDGSAAPLIALLDRIIDSGFALPAIRRLYEVSHSVGDTLERLQHLAPTEGGEAALL